MEKRPTFFYLNWSKVGRKARGKTEKKAHVAPKTAQGKREEMRLEVGD